MLTNQTGHYYFNLLSEEEQKQFKENCIKYKNEQHFEDYMNATHTNFEAFICCHFNLGVPFSWGYESGRDKYWDKISNRRFDKQPAPEPKEPTNSELLTMIVELKKEINMLKSHLNIQE